MRVSIITAAYKRHDLLRLYCGYHKALTFPGISVDVIIAGHENEVKAICEETGCTFVYAENKPLSNKFNKACKAAKGSDFVIIMGSDNFIDSRLIPFFTSDIKIGQLMMGVLDAFKYQPSTNKLAYSRGYTNHRTGEILGAYKAVSAKYLRRINWTPWESGLESSLDFSMMQRFKAVTNNSGFTRINQSRMGYFSVAIKTGFDKNKFNAVKNHIIPNSNFQNRMPELYEKVKNLT